VYAIHVGFINGSLIKHRTVFLMIRKKKHLLNLPQN